jgi:class 3 adenylate cyclase
VVEHARTLEHSAAEGFGRFSRRAGRLVRNSGEAVVREIGGKGHAAYPLVGDTVNTGARLEGLAPVGGVLIGTQTYERLPRRRGGRTARACG